MTARRRITRINSVSSGERADQLAVEAPLVLGLDGQTLAVLMRTPGHDLDLAAGWLTVESGVRSAGDIVQLEQCRSDDTDRVDITLADGVRRPEPRAFVTSAACGVCSADVLDVSQLAHWARRLIPARYDARFLAGLPDVMRARQRVFDQTGGVHAAAIASATGELVVVREDVGRHNAVDKVVGRCLLDGLLPLRDHLLVVSGRVSFEIVQKALAAGVDGIVAVSAPSSLAVDLSREHGLLLAGMSRGDRVNVYAGAEMLANGAGGCA